LSTRLDDPLRLRLCGQAYFLDCAVTVTNTPSRCTSASVTPAARTGIAAWPSTKSDLTLQ
jgi:hypothetical protein